MGLRHTPREPEQKLQQNNGGNLPAIVRLPAMCCAPVAIETGFVRIGAGGAILDRIEAGRLEPGQDEAGQVESGPGSGHGAAEKTGVARVG